MREVQQMLQEKRDRCRLICPPLSCISLSAQLAWGPERNVKHFEVRRDKPYNNLANYRKKNENNASTYFYRRQFTMDTRKHVITYGYMRRNM